MTSGASTFLWLCVARDLSDPCQGKQRSGNGQGEIISDQGKVREFNFELWRIDFMIRYSGSKIEVI